MSLEKDFRSMMTDTVVFYSSASVNKYGQVQYGSGSSASVSYYARLVYGDRILRDNEGREIVEAGRAILYAAAPSLTTLYKIVLPDGSTPKITDVSTIKDEDGNHHTVVGFGL